MSALPKVPEGLSRAAGNAAYLLPGVQSGTKRVTTRLGGDGGTGVTSSVTDALHRILVGLPVATTRWRLRVQNRDNSLAPPANYTGVLTFQPVYVGAPTFDSPGIWNGKASGLTQAVQGFSTASDGSEYVSEWVTDPTLQFVAGKVQAMSYGFTAPGGTSLPRGNQGCYLRFGAGSAAQVATASPTGGSTVTQLTLVDVRLEYETTAPIKVGLFIGDSITAGYVGDGSASNGAFMHETWVGAGGMREPYLWINAGIGGSRADDWVTYLSQRLAQFDLTTTVPDFAVVSLGTNDVNASVAAATVEGNLASLHASMRATYGIQPVYAGTIIPRAFAGAVETARVAVNNWLRNMPSSLTGVVDFDKVIALQATPASGDADLLSTPPHPTRGGYQRMGSLARF